MIEKTVFFVVGRLGDSLVYQKIIPFIKNNYFGRIFIFKENQGFFIEGAEYILLPFWLRKLKYKFIKRIIRLIYEPIQLLKYAIKYKPDYINGIYTLPTGLNSVIVSTLIGSKSIVSVIGGTVEIDTYNRFKNIWCNINILMLKKASIVTTTGFNVTDYIVSLGVKQKKIFEFTGAVDTNKFFFDKHIKKDIDILFVGTFRGLKGPDRVVEMIHQIIAKGTKINAHFLGDGYLFKEIAKKVMLLRLINYITLEGYIKNPCMFFQRSKLVIMPSRSEGLSMAMLEAMSCIVSNVGNMTDAAKHDINSFVVDDYKNIGKFIEYIEILLKDGDKWKYMSQNAITTVIDKYAVLKQTQIAEQIIEYGGRLSNG